MFLLRWVVKIPFSFINFETRSLNIKYYLFRMFDNKTFGLILSNKLIRYIGRSIVHKINHESGIK